MACSCAVKLGVGVMVSACYLVISNIDTNPPKAPKGPECLPGGWVGLDELLGVEMRVVVVLDDILPPAYSES